MKTEAGWGASIQSKSASTAGISTNNNARAPCRCAKGATRSHRTLFTFTLDANAGNAHCNSGQTHTHTPGTQHTLVREKKKKNTSAKRAMNFKAIYRNANERNAKKIVEKGKILKLTLMFGIQYRCVVVSYATTNELFPTIPTHTHTAIGVLTPSSSQMRPFKHMRNSPSRRERKGVRERGWERGRAERRNSSLGATQRKRTQVFEIMCGFAKWLKLMYFFRLFFLLRSFFLSLDAVLRASLHLAMARWVLSTAVAAAAAAAAFSSSSTFFVCLLLVVGAVDLASLRSNT